MPPRTPRGHPLAPAALVGIVLLAGLTVAFAAHAASASAPTLRSGLPALPAKVTFPANRTFVPIAGDPGTGRPLGAGPVASAPRPEATGNSGQIVARIAIQGGPYPGVYDNRTGDVYVTDSATNNVSVISTVNDTLVATIPVGYGAQMPCLDPKDGTLFVSNFYSGNVTVISVTTERAIASISLYGYEPTTPTWDPATDQVFIPNPNYSTNYANVTAVYGSNGTVKANINLVYATGADPITPTIDPVNGLLYSSVSSAYYGGNWIETINASTDTSPNNINVGSYPTQPVYDPVNHLLYEANNGGQTVTAINGSSNSVVKSVVVGYGPNMPGIDPVSGDVFVPAWIGGNGNVTVINDANESIVTVVPLGVNPYGLFADAQDGDLYVPEANQDNLTVLSMANDTVLQNYSIGPSPQMPVADGSGDLFVPYTTNSYLNGSVAVIAGPSLHASLQANPSPAYTGQPLSLETRFLGGVGALSFNYSHLPMGCSSADAPQVNCTPQAAGTFAVAVTVSDTQGDQANASLDLVVIPAYNITFNSVGLPSGDAWFVNASGLRSVESVNQSVTVSVPDGVYTVRLATGNKDYAPSPPSIPLHVAGSAFALNVNFTLVTYAVTITATGLPSATEWFFNLTGATTTLATAINGSTTAVALDNGTHRFAIAAIDHRYGPAPAAGTLTIVGKPQRLNVTFHYETYLLPFDEAGLPTSAIWYLNVTGQSPLASSLSVASLPLANGSYAYTVATDDKSYAPTVASGSLVVNGAHAPVDLTFAPFTFAVTFTESGLPASSNWTVHLGKVALSGTATSLATALTNGSYSYSVAPIAGWHADAYSGTVTVAGSTPSPVEVRWSPMVYAVTFSAQGLGSGVGWTLTVGNQSYPAQGGSIVVNLANGSYAYTFGSVSGYALSNGSGVLAVQGSVTGATAFYSASGLGALSGTLLYVALAAVVILVAVAAFVLVRRRRASAPSPSVDDPTGELAYDEPPPEGGS